MLDSHVKFHSANGKRLVLIVDDEAINREMLSFVLNDQYELIYAENGEQALALVNTHFDTLSLVLLDLNLPDIHGLDILRTIKADPHLSHLPVIVLTSDKEAEVESLTIGASDFIPKPYPMPKVVLARVLRSIELSEDRDIIRSTERDHLTGLYNREYFYRYAEQFDMHHKDMSMDAIVVDVNHFLIINERYGRDYADGVLRRIGERVREIVKDSGGIVCRREADTFLVYCPHRTDYLAILENASRGLSGVDGADNRVRLRMGVYSEVDKSIDIERRFDRAKLAADTVRNSFVKAIGIYDNALHESEIFTERLLEDFQRAVDEKEFQVYYQPKFDIRPAEPVLCSAEALVRWKHPQLGMISPGVFIPLFENNGLVQRLDSYIWREVARQQREWKDRIGFSVPVSINVSRIDMLDTKLVEHMRALLEEFRLEYGDMHLEITESAYTQDSEQIIETVNQLREAGFMIEMDDFGSGYSSLNMISTLPVDALKLDMQFIRNAFSERRDTRMLEVVIEIADSLGVPTIAEGVETAEQMFTLKAMGCDIVQGYYFSRPIPVDEYEKFLLKHRPKPLEQDEREHSRHSERSSMPDKFTYDALHDPLTGLYNQSAFEMLLRDADPNHIAVLMVSVDDFRSVVAEKGSEIGDQVIRKVAKVLRHSFRSVDFICRINRDEFAVIMSRVNSAMRKTVFDKVERANELLMRSEEDLPPVSLSVGVAFADRENPQGDIVQDADTALFRMKQVRRCGCAI
ncbi:MAG: EAL domain-containing protein, partial [Clostridia bacterium]|nr:EAL domain-containing protein [Clostridia bacterium]